MDENVEKQPEKQLGGFTGKGFMPGQSGNPGGRPKGTFSIRRLIAERVQQNPEEARQIIDAVYRRALADNDSKEFKYIETIIESVDGKLTQPIEQSVNITDLSEFTAEELQAFRDMLKERKSAKSE